eukprot:jgi/Botrbrau1/14647/Bobra.0108s0008.2
MFYAILSHRKMIENSKRQVLVRALLASLMQASYKTILNGTDILDIEHWLKRVSAVYEGLLGNASFTSVQNSQDKNSSGASFPIPSTNPTDPIYNWPNWGNGILNTRHAQHERMISPNNAGSLVVKSGWPVRVFGDVSATPTVVNGTVYVVDWGTLKFFANGLPISPYLNGDGHLTAIDANTGRIKWTREVQSYTGVVSVSRTSPAIEGDILVIGTLHSSENLNYLANSTFMVAVNATNGELLWKTMVDPHPLAIITMSPTIYNGGVYFGVSSMESVVKRNDLCCSFKGSVQKLDLYTGQLTWKFSTMPDGHFYGGAIWGSSPSIDVKRNQVYFSTGQNYKVPSDVRDCYAKNEGNYTAQAECSPADNHFDSILALDLDSGKLRWSRRCGARDIFLAACHFDLLKIFGYNCSGPPNTPEADHDFGQAPMLILGKHGRNDMVVSGQKSSIVWALNPDNGTILWAVDLGGSSTYGGMEMGCASDGERIFMSNMNFGRNNQTTNLINPPPGGSSTALGGFLAALDLDGNILWEAANPYPAILPALAGGSPFASMNVGPLTVANNVVYWPSYDVQGHLMFLDARTGQTLGTFCDRPAHRHPRGRGCCCRWQRLCRFWVWNTGCFT